jgi:4-amino-4-deoxy-L-arabinose transferase-like glycosyltransferase
MKQRIIFGMALKKPFLFYFLMILLIFSTFSRFINLDADRSIHFSGYPSDEGYYTQQARSKINFDTWFDDDILNGLTIAPLFTYLVYLSYKIFDVSLFSTRFISALAGFFSLIVFYFILKKEYPKEAVFITLLLSINTIFFVMSSVAMSDVLMILFILISFYIILYKSRYFAFLFAGFILALGFLSRITQIYVLPVFVIFFSIQLFQRRIPFKKIVFFFLGYGATILASLLFYYSPIYNLIENTFLYSSSLNKFYLFVFRPFFIQGHSFFSWPSIFLLSLLTIIFFYKYYNLSCSALFRDLKNMDKIEQFACSWLFGSLFGILFTGMNERRISLIIIPLVLYAGLLLFSKKKKNCKNIVVESKSNSLFFLFLFVGFFLNAILLLYPNFYQKVYRSIYVTNIPFSQVLSEYFLFIVLFSSLLFLFLYLMYKDRKNFIYYKYQEKILLLLLASLFISFFRFNLIRFIPYFYQFGLRFQDAFMILILAVVCAFLFLYFISLNSKPFLRTLLGILVIYSLLVLSFNYIIMPTFTVKELNEQIGELTSEGDFVIGYFSHGVSFENIVKPLFWSYHWPFNQTESLINNQDFKPKLYLNSVKKSRHPSPKELGYDLGKIGTYELTPLYGFGKPRNIIQVSLIHSNNVTKPKCLPPIFKSESWLDS